MSDADEQDVRNHDETGTTGGLRGADQANRLRGAHGKGSAKEIGAFVSAFEAERSLPKYAWRQVGFLEQTSLNGKVVRGGLRFRKLSKSFGKLGARLRFDAEK